MDKAPMISRERAAVEPISEAVRLSDALLGAIRVRVNEEKRPLRNADAVRRMVREALVASGMPFVKNAGDLSLTLAEGVLLTQRLAEDLTEYVWLRDISDQKKIMGIRDPRHWLSRV